MASISSAWLLTIGVALVILLAMWWKRRRLRGWLLKLRSEERRLEYHISATIRSYRRDIKAARKRGARSEEIEELRAHESTEYFMLSDELEVLRTRRLLAEATRLDLSPAIEVPHGYDREMENEHWRLGGFGWHLNTKGRSALTTAIREERKARHNLWLPWIGAVSGLVAAIAGLIGVTIGLLSVLR